MLFCHSHCDLDLYPIEPEMDREHLLSMTSVFMKFEKAGPNQTLNIDRTSCIRRTDRCKATPPHFFKKGHNHSEPEFFENPYLPL